MKKVLGWKILLFSILFMLPFFGWWITRIVESVKFDNNCTYHINQALGSSRSTDEPKYAANEIDIAINYIDTHNLAYGVTSIVDKSSSEDLSIWHTSLTKKQTYLHELAEESPESITKYKDYVVARNLYSSGGLSIPDGISVYPHNTLFCVWGWISGLLSIIGVIGIITFINEKSK